MANLPATSKAYSVRANVPFQANTTQLDLAQSFMWSFKQHMKDTMTGGTVGGTRHANSVWTCKGSGDGAGSFGMDNIDRWSAYTNLIWNATGSAHSWIVLENTTLDLQVCIDCNSATTTLVGVIATEISSPFGSLAAGTNTARPTSSREFVWNFTGTGTSATATFLTDVATGNSNWTHYVTTVDGQFHVSTSRTGLGLFTTFIALQRTFDNHVSDTRNVFWLGHSTNFNRGAPAATTVIDTAAGCVGRDPNGLAIGSGGARRFTFGANAYPQNFGIDAVSGNYLATTVDVVSLGAQVSKRGRIPDMYSIGTAPLGSSVPSVSAQERVVMGDFVVPFPTVVPTI